MKKKSIFIIIFLTIWCSGQKIAFTPSVKVEYTGSLHLGAKYHQNQKFVLLGNSQDYYFAAGQNYLNDTRQYISKGIDTRAISDYFQERVIRSNNKTSVFTIVSDTNIRYEESQPLRWVLYSDIKMINGVKCQMAAINKYGRRWIAYFSKDYPLSLGPYKFTGLPGLIFELYDTKNDYHFTVTKVEKNSNEFTYNLSPFKLMSKKNYLQASYNMKYTLAAFPPIDDEGFRRETQSMLDKLKMMYNNPLELKPFE